MNRQHSALSSPASGFLTDNQAVAACVLWGAGFFDTFDIAELLHVREDAVMRTLHMAKDGARERPVKP